mmetsp:Transcript_124107/g.196805  ORF Transcript_124107/g.196805 Transcript_124107/m.196805 type:complete len:282 (+) Transcript_124107:1394-2239(+)
MTLTCRHFLRIWATAGNMAHAKLRQEFFTQVGKIRPASETRQDFAVLLACFVPLDAATRFIKEAFPDMMANFIEDVRPFLCWQHFESHTSFHLDQSRLWTWALQIHVVIISTSFHGELFTSYNSIITCLIIVFDRNDHVAAISSERETQHILCQFLFLQLLEVVSIKELWLLLITIFLFSGSWFGFFYASEILEFALFSPSTSLITTRLDRKLQHSLWKSIYIYRDLRWWLILRCFIFLVIFVVCFFFRSSFLVIVFVIILLNLRRRQSFPLERVDGFLLQ